TVQSRESFHQHIAAVERQEHPGPAGLGFAIKSAPGMSLRPVRIIAARPRPKTLMQRPPAQAVPIERTGPRDSYILAITRKDEGLGNQDNVFRILRKHARAL